MDEGGHYSAELKARSSCRKGGKQSDNAQQLYMGCLDVSRGLRRKPVFTEQHFAVSGSFIPASEEKFAVLIFRDFARKPRSALSVTLRIYLNCQFSL